jgi:hypothetical protein
LSTDVIGSKQWERHRHLEISLYVFIGYLVTSVENFVDNSKNGLGVPVIQLKMCVTTEH